MTPKNSTPNSAARRTRVAPTVYPPFSRVDPNYRAPVEEFEREHMGLAAKE
jgi:hypothetical protein